MFPSPQPSPQRGEGVDSATYQTTPFKICPTNSVSFGNRRKSRRQIRINLVSPTVLTESAAAVALAYRRSVEGVQTGRVYKVGY